MSKDPSICDGCGEYDHECLCDAITLGKLQAELESLRKSRAELELKCALANAQLFNLKRALERIIEDADPHYNDDDSIAWNSIKRIASDALKGSTCA